MSAKELLKFIDKIKDKSDKELDVYQKAYLIQISEIRDELSFDIGCLYRKHLRMITNLEQQVEVVSILQYQRAIGKGEPSQ